jgi:hypothetical protein
MTTIQQHDGPCTTPTGSAQISAQHIASELATMRRQLLRACEVDTRYRAHIGRAISRLDSLAAAVKVGNRTKPGPKPKTPPAAKTAPYPNISAPAWVVLLRIGVDQPVTAQSAAGLVGPYLAAEAVAELEAKHLSEEGFFTPLAKTLRRWDRARATP